MDSYYVCVLCIALCCCSCWRTVAGSERLAQTNAQVGGTIQKEGAFINKSLMFLGVIISKLSEGGPESVHLPFRESKLTRILQSSLGGNARTSIICTVSPASSNVEQTVSTLRFGARAIRIQNHAKVNEISLENALINKQKNSIRELQDRLSGMHFINSSAASAELDKENRDAEDRLMLAQHLEREERTASQVAALQAEIANLQSFIHHPAGYVLPGAQSGAAAGSMTTPRKRHRRRHTYGTPSKLRPFGASPASTSSGGGGAGPGGAFASPHRDRNAFRAEQLQTAQAKILAFETLLSELSAENGELTQYQDQLIARCELVSGTKSRQCAGTEQRAAASGYLDRVHSLCLLSFLFFSLCVFVAHMRRGGIAD